VVVGRLSKKMTTPISPTTTSNNNNATTSSDERPVDDGRPVDGEAAGGATIGAFDSMIGEGGLGETAGFSMYIYRTLFWLTLLISSIRINLLWS
jgi:hypothetical protein